MQMFFRVKIGAQKQGGWLQETNRGIGIKKGGIGNENPGIGKQNTGI